MPTTVTRYVDTASSGGDGTTQAHSGGTAAYASLQAAITAQVSARANLVSNDETLVIYCAGSTADVEAVLAGFTTDATRKITIAGDPTAPNSDGLNTGNTFSNSHYRIIADGATDALDIQNAYTDITGIQVKVDSANAGKYGILINNGCTVTNIDRCRYTNPDPPQHTSHGLNSSFGTTSVTNCTFEMANFFSTGQGVTVFGGTCNLFNCTIEGAQYGVYQVAGTVNVTNCAVFNCGDDFLNTITLLNCANDDDGDTHTGRVDLNENASSQWTNAFTSYTTGDYRVKDTSSLVYNAGTNSGAPNHDIINTARPQATTTDIGAFELSTAGPPQDLTVGFFSARDPVAIVTQS